MARFGLRRPSPGVLVALIAVVLAVGGFAFAAIPDQSGVIHACYKKKKGALRVVGANKRCGRRERRLAWHQRRRGSEPQRQRLVPERRERIGHAAKRPDRDRRGRERLRGVELISGDRPSS